MNFGNLSDNLPIIITVVLLIVLQFFLRRRRNPDASNSGIAQGLLSETRYNLSAAEAFSYDRPGRQFMTTSWKLYRNKLDFLDQKTRTAVTDTYMVIEDYNQQIASAKKFKSTSYLASINVSRLEEMLAETEEGLEHWIDTRIGPEEETPKTPGLFGDFTGRS